MQKLIIIFLLVFVVFLSSCSQLEKTSVDLLVEKLRWQIWAGKIEEIYDESDESVHKNVLKEDFVTALNTIVKEAKQMDKDFNWKENHDLGESFRFERLDKYNHYSAFRKIESEQTKISFLVYWSDESGSPKLSGLTAMSYKNGEQLFHIDLVRGAF